MAPLKGREGQGGRKCKRYDSAEGQAILAGTPRMFRGKQRSADANANTTTKRITCVHSTSKYKGATVSGIERTSW